MQVFLIFLWDIALNPTFKCTFSVPLVLVGNKSDLHMDRRVSQEEGKSLASQMNAVFIETSAKENRVPNRNDVTHSSFKSHSVT